MSAETEDAGVDFEALRPTLIRVAYRMLGSVADAEDIVQDAFIRWMGVNRAAIREPAAFLRTTVTRLCLDRIRAARRLRDTYIGPWLPDPVIEEPGEDDFTLPLMLALERLSPLERAAFLLHDVFGLGFEEVAATIARDPAACRQLASRARLHVREARPRYPVETERGLAIARAFFDASRSGDMTAFTALLGADVNFHSDGGGKRRAALRPLYGRDDVLRLHGALAARYRQHGSTFLRAVTINGLPGFLSREADDLLQTTALVIEGDRIAAIFVMRNPDKLGHLSGGV